MFIIGGERQCRSSCSNKNGKSPAFPRCLSCIHTFDGGRAFPFRKGRYANEAGKVRPRAPHACGFVQTLPMRAGSSKEYRRVHHSMPAVHVRRPLQARNQSRPPLSLFDGWETMVVRAECNIFIQIATNIAKGGLGEANRAVIRVVQAGCIPVFAFVDPRSPPFGRFAVRHVCSRHRFDRQF